MAVKNSFWHYIRVGCVLNDKFPDTSGGSGNAESIIKLFEICFGNGGLANMQSAPVLLFEGGRDTLLDG